MRPYCNVLYLSVCFTLAISQLLSEAFSMHMLTCKKSISNPITLTHGQKRLSPAVISLGNEVSSYNRDPVTEVHVKALIGQLYTIIKSQLWSGDP